MIDIGKRLRQLREAKGLSQGHIEERTGLFRCYVSRIECGHTIPQLENLEKWANALGVTLSEIFAENEIARKPAKLARLTFYEKRLLELLRGLNEMDRRLILSVANTMVKQWGKHRRPE
jgi:transcriptional regulator with XRE-family HTH domain